MIRDGLILLTFVLIALLIIAWPLGCYIARVLFSKENPKGSRLNYEVFITSKLGVSIQREHTPMQYLLTLIIFNTLCGIVLAILISVFGNVKWDQTLNIVISYISSTNWQTFIPENMQHPALFSFGFIVNQFISAGTGLAVTAAFLRSFDKVESEKIGSFWVDLIRSILWILLPLSIFISIIFAALGIPQTFPKKIQIQNLEGILDFITVGPYACFEAIKILGGNGGGFTLANSAHPFENPNFISNIFHLLIMALLPAALILSCRAISMPRRERWLLFFLICALWTLFSFLVLLAMSRSATSIDLRLEGIETRFGVIGSALYSSLTTATTCGATNSAFSSLKPSVIGVLIIQMAHGGVVFGGVGIGLITLLLYVLVGRFLASLLTGRGESFAKKRLTPQCVGLSFSALMIIPVFSLLFAAVSMQITANVRDAHQTTQELYTFLSATLNNGSSLYDPSNDGVLKNILVAIAMLIGRYGFMGLVIFLAGHLASQKNILERRRSPKGDWVRLLVVGIMILMIGGLSFAPVLMLGPVAEYFAGS